MQQQKQKTASWWPLAAVGLALVAMLATGCAKCKQCKPGSGGGGPRAGGPKGHGDDDGLNGRLEDSVLANDGRPPGVPRNAVPAEIPNDVPEGPAANQPPGSVPGDSPNNLPSDAFPVPVPGLAAGAPVDDVLLLRSRDQVGVVSVRGGSGRRPEAEARLEDL